MAKLPLKMIDTEGASAHLRGKAVDLENRRLLITRLSGSKQECDLSTPPNCDGFGRVRHFRRSSGGPDWPENPLPIEPACSALGLPHTDMIEAQAFQNAVCNWRCWYCFVPFDLLSANPKFSDWMGAGELIDLYLAESDRPRMIDLTGGQPDLVPEWVPWTMEALRERGLEGKVYLWSDDNLSNDYFWKYLSDAERDLICGFRGYGRVCCFKGFNAESFSFNTRAHPDLFEQQFDLFNRLLGLGIDLYAYVTLTTPTEIEIEKDIEEFVDRLQALDRNLPLRTVPLEIQVFTPVTERLEHVPEDALRYQWRAIRAWVAELEKRFSVEERAVPINKVVIGRGLR